MKLGFNNKKLLYLLSIVCSFVLLIVSVFSYLPPLTALAEDGSSKVVSKLYIQYLGTTLTEPKTLTPEDFLVTVVYEDETTANISYPNYVFTSSLDIIEEGETTISIYYANKNASCTVTYYTLTTEVFYSVIFDTNGGNSISPIMGIVPGTLITMPATPVRIGYWFRGWYTESSFLNEFDPHQKIKQNYTLYAKWEERENPATNLMSVPLNYQYYSAKLSIDLSDQVYGCHVVPSAEPIAYSDIKKAAQNISKTAACFAFRFDVADYEFFSDRPLKVLITLPAGFDATKVTIYYTPDEAMIEGACQGNAQKTNIYEFLSYHPGTYLVMQEDANVVSGELTPTKPPVVETTPTAGPTATYIPEPTEDPDQTPSIRLSVDTNLKIGSTTTAKLIFRNIPEIQQELMLFNWTSSNTSVATVSDTGYIQALKAGTTTIIATSDDELFQASADITVSSSKTVLVKKIKLNKTSLTLKKGKTYQLKATISPSNATNKKVSFTSSNKKIATVSSKGKVKGIKKGSCTIKVKAKDKSGISVKVKVTVKN